MCTGRLRTYRTCRHVYPDDKVGRDITPLPEIPCDSPDTCDPKACGVIGAPNFDPDPEFCDDCLSELKKAEDNLNHPATIALWDDAFPQPKERENFKSVYIQWMRSSYGSDLRRDRGIATDINHSTKGRETMVRRFKYFSLFVDYVRSRLSQAPSLRGTRHFPEVCAHLVIHLQTDTTIMAVEPELSAREFGDCLRKWYTSLEGHVERFESFHPRREFLRVLHNRGGGGGGR